MKLRAFTDPGIGAFRGFLAACRNDPETSIARELLEDESCTTVILPEIEVAQTQFSTRRQAAEYLNDLLAPLPISQVSLNAGLWTWLSLFFFDEICPARNGRRTVKNEYHYIYSPRNIRHSYKHLLFLAWRVKQIAPVYNRLFLNGPLYSLDKVTTEVMKRLYLTRVPCIFEVLDRLYWDDHRGRARQGIVSPNSMRPGDLMHRLPLRMRQLEKTFDLISLSADDLIILLGDEFRFEPAPTQVTRAPSIAG